MCFYYVIEKLVFIKIEICKLVNLFFIGIGGDFEK